MSEDDDWDEKKKEWESRMASGQPMQLVKMDLPMKVIRDQAGGIFVDTATLGLLGFDRLGVVRIEVTAEALESLKQALDALEKNPDMQTVEARKPPTN